MPTCLTTVGGIVEEVEFQTLRYLLLFESIPPQISEEFPLQGELQEACANVE